MTFSSSGMIGFKGHRLSRRRVVHGSNMVRQIASLVTAALFALPVAYGQGNRDLFQFGYDDDDNGMGQPNWDRVQCRDIDTCPGYPEKFPAVLGNYDFFRWTVDDNGNGCRWCPEGGPENCGVHRQSPINLVRNVGEANKPYSKECLDWHWMQFKDDTCTWDIMRDQFEITRHALSIHVPTREDGTIDCWIQGQGRKFPRLDYSKGFPDWWWMQRTDIVMPSNHWQEGHQYAAEVTLAHFYQVAHAKNEMGYVTIFMQDYDDAEVWPYLDKLICMWREEEEKVRAECGLPPAEPYGRCRLFRGQEASETWLQEAGMMPVAAPSTQPTSSRPTPQTTNGPTKSPTPPPSTAPTPLPTPPISAPVPAPTVNIQTRKPAMAPADSPADSTVSPLQETPPIVVLTDELGLADTFPPPPPLEEPTVPTLSPTKMPVATSTGEPAAPPSVQQTMSPFSEPAQSPTDPAGEVVGDELVPEPIDCDAYEYLIAGGYGRMCHSSDPCCGSQRSDTSYCQNVYDNIFPGSAIYSACYYCCPGGNLKVGEPNPPHPEIPKTIQCSNYNAQRYCKEGGCCETTRPTQGYCISEYLLYGDDVFNQICWYCCREPVELGPPPYRRGLRGEDESKQDYETLAMEDRQLRGELVQGDGDEQEHRKEQQQQASREADDPSEENVIIYSEGRKFQLTKQDFEPNDEDPEEYFYRIYNDYKHRHRALQGVAVHEENYEDVEYWPYEWLLKVGTEYYYRYEGTQTVPPCREFVHWRIMKDPIRVHPRQIVELNRLLAWRRNPADCNIDTAGVLSPDGNSVKVDRDLQYGHKGHRDVFCECKDWPSKFDGDKEWCRNWESDVNYDRFYNRPYSYPSDGWLPTYT